MELLSVGRELVGVDVVSSCKYLFLKVIGWGWLFMFSIGIILNKGVGFVWIFR